MRTEEFKPDCAAASGGKARLVELIISTLLRAGVFTSLAVVVLGLILSFIHHPQYTSSPQELERLTRPGAAFPHTLGAVWSGVLQLRGEAVIAAGLLLLIATPVMRVAVSIVLFVYEKDRVFVAITSVVLALLLVSFLLGHTAG